MTNDIKQKLEALARRSTWTEDPEEFNPYEQSGGNFDDAYFAGCSDGATVLARELLALLFPPTNTIPPDPKHMGDFDFG